MSDKFQVWACKIGVEGDVSIPYGGDLPMRQAIQKAFFELTGVHAKFIFSGWNAQLTEGEKNAVAGDRRPAPKHRTKSRTKRRPLKLLKSHE